MLEDQGSRIMITQTNILQSIIPTINGKIGKKISNWGEGWGCPQLGKNSHIFPFLFLEDVPKRYFDNKDFKQLKMTRFFLWHICCTPWHREDVMGISGRVTHLITKLIHIFPVVTFSHLNVIFVTLDVTLKQSQIVLVVRLSDRTGPLGILFLLRKVVISQMEPLRSPRLRWNASAHCFSWKVRQLPGKVRIVTESTAF